MILRMQGRWGRVTGLPCPASWHARRPALLLIHHHGPLLLQVAVPQDAASLKLAADLAALLNPPSDDNSTRRRRLFASGAPATHAHLPVNSEGAREADGVRWLVAAGRCDSAPPTLRHARKAPPSGTTWPGLILSPLHYLSLPKHLKPPSPTIRKNMAWFI